MTSSGCTLGAPLSRVVVVGMGAVSAHGVTAGALWEGVSSGLVAIRPVTRLPTAGYRSNLGGEAPVPGAHSYPRPGGFDEPFLAFTLAAADEALAQAGPGLRRVPAERRGLAVGNSMGAFNSWREWYIQLLQHGHGDGELLAQASPQAAVETVGSLLGFGGPLVSVTNSCAAGATAIGLAFDLIRDGQADLMLAGGTDCLTQVVFAAFDSIEAISPEPARPYSGGRRGLSLGEGSGLLVLLREDLALSLQLTVLAEVLGYGLSADGYDPTAPDPTGKGMARAMEGAMCAAGVTPDDVDYINGHGTGTPKNDPAESRAIQLALGSRAKRVPVSSTKSMIGHLLGGAGGVESVVTVRALQEGIVPPTAGFVTPDPECDLDYVPNAARHAPIDVALSNNFAFGGANATVAFGRYRSDRAVRPQTNEEVVITGLGVLTPDAADMASLRHAFESGAGWPPEPRSLHLDPSPFLTPRDCRRLDRLSIFAVVAAARALLDAGLTVTPENREQIGVSFGTGLGGLDVLERFFRPVLEEGPAAANPALAPSLVHNAATGQVAMRIGAVGPSITVTGAYAAGAMALALGALQVRHHGAQSMVCVAADTLTETMVRGFRDAGLLRPENALVPSDAGAAVVLEGRGSAVARRARIYGVLQGTGFAADGPPDAAGVSGMERALRRALAGAALNPGDIGEVWSGAGGIPASDDTERCALTAVFGEAVPVFTPSAMLGNTIGVAGLLNLALGVQSWQDGSPAQQKPIAVTSSSLGGTHVALIATPWLA